MHPPLRLSPLPPSLASSQAWDDTSSTCILFPTSFSRFPPFSTVVRLDDHALRYGHGQRSDYVLTIHDGCALSPVLTVIQTSYEVSLYPTLAIKILSNVLILPIALPWYCLRQKTRRHPGRVLIANAISRILKVSFSYLCFGSGTDLLISSALRFGRSPRLLPVR